jgi:hypothetical protein
MNFTSQICTTREQSEQLLALGLKKETADCIWCEVRTLSKDNPIQWHLLPEYIDKYDEKHIPAWSLHRLLEMMPSFIDIEGFAYMLKIIQGKLFSYYSNIAGHALLYGKGSVYESAIYTIECLIKGDYFNKEYLE